MLELVVRGDCNFACQTSRVALLYGVVGIGLSRADKASLIDVAILLSRGRSQGVHQLVKLLVAFLVFSPIPRLSYLLDDDFLSGVRKNRVQ
jgi:hypothetical protein